MSLYKCKCLWGMNGKGRDSSFQEEVLHTYTLKVEFLFCIKQLYRVSVGVAIFIHIHESIHYPPNLDKS